MFIYLSCCSKQTIYAVSGWSRSARFYHRQVTQGNWNKRVVIRGTQRPNVSKYTRSVSDGFLYTLRACLVNLELSLKTIYLFGCLGGTLVVTQVFSGFFVSSESVSYPYGSGRKLEDMKYVLSLYRKFRRPF